MASRRGGSRRVPRVICATIPLIPRTVNLRWRSVYLVLTGRFEVEEAEEKILCGQEEEDWNKSVW